MLRLTLVAALLAAVAAAPAFATPTELMPGVTYDKQLVLSRFGPQVVHVISAPRPGGLYTVGPLLSNAALPGRETVTAIERRLAPTATIVGVNGDFSTTEGVPTGLVVQGGVLNAQPNVKRSSIGWDATGLMRVERPGLNATWQGSGQRRTFSINRRPSASGTTLYTPPWGAATPVEPGSVEVVLPGLGKTVPSSVRSAAVSEVRTGGATPIPPDGAVLVGRGTSGLRITEEAKAGTVVTIRLVVNPDWSTIAEGLAGGPVLVRGGKAVFNAREDFSAAALAARSARVAVGQRADGTICLIVVDGGLPGFSVGMTNFELAQTLVRQGALSAAALEGGPAATLAFDGSLLNRPAKGERPVSELLAVQYSGVYAPPPQPALLSPNGDGVEESQTFRYRVVRPSAVTVALVDPAGASRVVESLPRTPGTYTVSWSGKKADGTLEQQGAWHWVVTAKDDLGRDSTADRPFTLDATLGALRVTPTSVPVGPSGGSLGIAFTLAAPATWRVTIESRGGVVLRTYTGRSSAPGPVSLRWDGRYRKAVRAYAGSHLVRVTTTSEFGTAALVAPFTVRRTG